MLQRHGVSPFAAAAALAWVAGARAAEPVPPGVGELEGPEFVAVRGARSFTPEAVNRAIFADVEVIRASHPAARRDEFLKLIRGKVASGYRRLGFPRAAVEVGVDEAGKPWLKVEEGPRYAAGEIKIEGNKAVAADTIKAAIREKVRCWESDQGLGEAKARAHFDAASLKAVRDGVSQAYADAGYLFPEFETDVAPDPAGGVAHLRVTVKGEGPRSFLGEIDVTGCQKNAPEDVIRASGLRVGQALTSSAVGEAYLRLIGTGRLRLAAITCRDAGRGDGVVELTIRIVEYEKAPPLSVPPSPHELVCLKLRDWLTAFVQGKCSEDMVATDERMGMELIVSPREGFIVKVASALESEEVLALIDSDGLVVVRTSAMEKLTIPGTDGYIAVHLNVTPDDPGDEKPSFAITFAGMVSPVRHERPHSPDFGATTVSSGAGLRFFVNKTVTNVGPVGYEGTLPPAAFAGLAFRKDTVYGVEGDTLTIADRDRRDGTLMVLDTRTGRLICFGTSGEGEGSDLTTFRPGAFAKARAEILAAAARCRERYRPEEALESAASFVAETLIRKGLLEELLEKELPGGELIAAALRARAVEVALAVARSFGKHFPGNEEDEEGERFCVPVPPELLKGAPSFSAMLAPSVWSVGHVFPPRSWPRTVARGAALVACNQKRYLLRDMRELTSSEEIGPTGCLAVAYLTSMLHPACAVICAEKGLKELSLAGLRKDCRTAFGVEELRRIAEAVVGALRDIDGDVVRAAEGLLTGTEAGTLRKTFRLLRERRDAEAEEVAMAVLEVWWDVWLEGRLRRAFAPFYEDYGALSLTTGDAEEGLASATQAIQLDAERASAYVVRGAARAALGKHEHALGDLDRAIELDPELASAYFRRGSVRAATGRAGARQDLEKAVELDPKGEAGESAKKKLQELEERGETRKLH